MTDFLGTSALCCQLQLLTWTECCILHHPTTGMTGNSNTPDPAHHEQSIVVRNLYTAALTSSLGAQAVNR